MNREDVITLSEFHFPKSKPYFIDGMLVIGPCLIAKVAFNEITIVLNSETDLVKMRDMCNIALGNLKVTDESTKEYCRQIRGEAETSETT